MEIILIDNQNKQNVMEVPFDKTKVSMLKSGFVKHEDKFLFIHKVDVEKSTTALIDPKTGEEQKVNKLFYKLNT